MSRENYTDLETSSAFWVRKNSHILADIPEPGVEWDSNDVEFGHRVTATLIDRGLIESIRGKRTDNGCKIFRTKEKLYDAIQTFEERRRQSDRLLPCSDEDCPGSGFTNRGTDDDGNTLLECSNCGEIHHKEDVNR